MCAVRMLESPFLNLQRTCRTRISRPSTMLMCSACSIPLALPQSQSYTLHFFLILMLFYRLWMKDERRGSIVITSSMSSRIINKSAEAEPLAQVRILP